MSDAPDLPLAPLEDVSAYLGITPHTMHQWIYKGTAPRSYKVGNRRRFRWSDVEAWLEERADDPHTSDGPGGDTGSVITLTGRTDQAGEHG